MPIYEYKCDHCGSVIEKQQGMNDEPLKECPECGGLLRRVFHPAGLIFKGSGFHITDYVKPEQDRKSKNASSASEGKPGSGSGSEGGGSSGSEGAGAGEGSGKTETAGSNTESKTSVDASAIKAPTGSSSGSSTGKPAGGATEKKNHQTEKK